MSALSLLLLLPFPLLCSGSRESSKCPIPMVTAPSLRSQGARKSERRRGALQSAFKALVIASALKSERRDGRASNERRDGSVAALQGAELLACMLSASLAHSLALCLRACYPNAQTKRLALKRDERDQLQHTMKNAQPPVHPHSLLSSGLGRGHFRISATTSVPALHLHLHLHQGPPGKAGKGRLCNIFFLGRKARKVRAECVLVPQAGTTRADLNPV